MKKPILNGKSASPSFCGDRVEPDRPQTGRFLLDRFPQKIEIPSVPGIHFSEHFL